MAGSKMRRANHANQRLVTRSNVKDKITYIGPHDISCVPRNFDLGLHSLRRLLRTLYIFEMENYDEHHGLYIAYRSA